jgi:hypothetical protein
MTAEPLQVDEEGRVGEGGPDSPSWCWHDGGGTALMEEEMA